MRPNFSALVALLPESLTGASFSDSRLGVREGYRATLTIFTVTLTSIKYYFYLLCRLAINLSHCCYENKMQMRVPAKGPLSYLYVPFLGKGIQALSNLTLRTYLCKIWTLVSQ